MRKRLKRRQIVAPWVEGRRVNWSVLENWLGPISCPHSPKNNSGFCGFCGIWCTRYN